MSGCWTLALRTCEQWRGLTIDAEYAGADGQTHVLAQDDFLRWGPIESHPHAVPLWVDFTFLGSDGEPFEIDLAFRTRAEEEARLMGALRSEHRAAFPPRSSGCRCLRGHFIGDHDSFKLSPIQPLRHGHPDALGCRVCWGACAV